MNMCLVWQDGTDLKIYRQKNILFRLLRQRVLSGYFFRINTQLESNTSP